jgi:hypothetical protein
MVALALVVLLCQHALLPQTPHGDVRSCQEDANGKTIGAVQLLGRACDTTSSNAPTRATAEPDGGFALGRVVDGAGNPLTSDRRTLPLVHVDVRALTTLRILVGKDGSLRPSP